MKAHPFTSSFLTSIASLCLVASLVAPGDAQADRLLGSPVEKTKRDGRVLGAPGDNTQVRPIQQGHDPSKQLVIIKKSEIGKKAVPSAPRTQIRKSEVPAPPKATKSHQPQPVAIVEPVKAAKKESAPERVVEVADTPPAPKPTPVVAEKKERRIKPTSSPSWQNLYRLGAGDVLNFSLYLRPELTRSDVQIAPDGSVSYLQAISIPAEGRTIDQLKWALEHSLSEYHKDPQVIITPAFIGSKQFSIIGRVREPGAYSLDRPTTILEGLALAQGIAVGTVGGQLNEIADMHHSFVARDGHKLDVNLAKLYHEGDFSQNAYLEPDDYVYIASVLNQEYYILGYVSDPGRKRMATKTTVARAVAEASGYEDGAWKKQVLLVRGSIHNPETTVVDLRAIIKGKQPDIEIESGDIIYVRERPTHLLEEAVDEAIFTFVQTATAEAINEEIGTTIDAGE